MAVIRHKRGASGFTLVETLTALVILVIMTGIVAMGVPVAFKAYTNAVDGSNSQVLLTTATTVLRDELGMARQVELQSGGELGYYVTGDGYWASLEAETPGLMKHVYSGTVPGEDEYGSGYRLITKQAATESLDVKFKSITYDEGVFTVNGLEVYRLGESDEKLASVDQYEIKAALL